jgi:hypothetical protein
MAAAPLRSLPSGLPWDPPFDPQIADLATKMAATASKVDGAIQYKYYIHDFCSPTQPSAQQIITRRHQIPYIFGWPSHPEFQTEFKALCKSHADRLKRPPLDSDEDLAARQIALREESKEKLNVILDKFQTNRVVSVSLASDEDLAANQIALKTGEIAFKVGVTPGSAKDILHRLKNVYQPPLSTCNLTEEERVGNINCIIADAKAAKDEQGNYKCIQLTADDEMMFNLNSFSANPYIFAQFIPETCSLHVYKFGSGGLDLEYMLPLPFEHLNQNPGPAPMSVRPDYESKEQHPPTAPAPIVKEQPAPLASNRKKKCVIL